MERIALILKYLNGQLDAEERMRFETRLQEDAGWAKEVATVKEEWDYQRLSDWLGGRLSEEEEQDLKQELEGSLKLQQQLEEVKNIEPVLTAAHQKMILKDVKEVAASQKKIAPTQKTGGRKWLIAAVLFFLLLLCFYLFYLPAQYSNEAIARQYFEAYPAQGNLLNLEENTPILAAYKNGAKAYDQGSYSEAIPFFNRIPKVSPFYQSGQFYLANAHLALQENEEAIRILSWQLNDSPDDSYKSRLQWYLALAYIQAGNEERAIVQLRQLGRQKVDLFYQKQAKTLLDQLGSSWRDLPGVK